MKVMKRMSLLGGLFLMLAAMFSASPRAEAARPVCNILCVPELKCCIVRGQPTCVPISTVCHP
jgi:hypothetical protein